MLFNPDSKNMDDGSQVAGSPSGETPSPVEQPDD